MNSANRSLITAFFKSPAGGGGQEELAEEPCLYGCSRSGAGLEVAKLQQSWLPTRQSCARAPAIDSVVSENSCTSLLSLGSTTSEEEEGGGAGGRGFAVNLSGLLSQGFAAGMGMGMVHRGGPSFSLITPTEPPAEPLLSCDLTPTQPLLSCDLTVTHPPLSCDLTPLEAPLSHDLTSPELPLPSGVQVTQCSVSQLENGATILANRQRLVQTGESEDSFQIEAGDLQPLADPSQNMSGVPHSPAAGSVPNQSQLWAGDLQTEVRGALGGAGGILNGLGGLERASGGGSELEKKNSNDEEGEGRGRRSAVDGGGKEEEKDEGELEIVEVNSRSQYSSEEVRAGISQFKGQSFTATTEQDGVSSSLEEESVVVVMATTPVKEPAVVDSSLTLSPSSSLSQPLPASSSLSSLSAPWAHIFRQTARRSSQTKETVLVTGSPPGRTRGTNKAFKRSRSASSSPRRCRSLSRSPRSAKKGSPLVRQGRGSAADLASPLRASAKVRKLLSFTEPSPKRVRGEERDWAPFSGLSHIRQDDSSDPFWNLEPKVPVFHESLAATLSHVPTTFCTTMEPATPRNSVAPTPPRIPLAPTATNSSQGLPKSSSVEAQSGKAEPKAPALLIPTPPSQTNAILEEITQRHPQENVRDIFQRYRLLKPGRISLPNTTPASKGPPPAIRTISSTLNRPHRPKKRRPLICRVHIRNGEAGRIEVDASVYESLPQTRRRRSARLRAQLDHPLSLSPATDTQSDTLTETDGKEMEAEREREMGAEREREMEKERKRDVKTERKREVETESKGEKDTDRKREETDRKKEMEKKEETARKRETEKKKEIAIETKRENTPNVCSHSTNSGDGAREKTVYCSPCELWSDVYRPTSSTDVIGNRTGVQRLRNWLLQWKNKCSSNSQNSSDQKSRPVGNESGGRKQVKLNVSQENLKKVFPPTPESVAMEADPNFSLRVHRHHRKGMSLNARSSDCEGEGEGEGEVGDWGGGDGEEGVCSVLLLCGPEGCGKTAAVYACASELGFKVFEVNSSSERSRGPLLATLKEATLSHQVSTHLHSPDSIFSFFTRNGRQRDATLASNEAVDGVKEKKREGGRRKEGERGKEKREEKGVKEKKREGGRGKEGEREGGTGKEKGVKEKKREGGRGKEGEREEDTGEEKGVKREGGRSRERGRRKKEGERGGEVVGEEKRGKRDTGGRPVEGGKKKEREEEEDEKEERKAEEGKKRRGSGLHSYFSLHGSDKENGAIVRRKERKRKSCVESGGGSEENSAHFGTGHARNSGSVSLATATVILLEEVDILFTADRGFWSGFYDLVLTSRRPLILTCNDPRLELDCDHIKITFEPPTVAELSLHIQLLCLSHDYHMTSEAVSRLAVSLRLDVRHVFHCLQFWLAGHAHKTPPTFLTEPHSATEPSETRWRTLGGTCVSFTHPLPLLSRPWRPLVCQSLPLLSRRDICRDLDITSHCTEQLSCADVIAMATESRDSHMISDDVIRPWWACPAEDSVLDEFSVMGECVWREREVNRAICEEVEGGGVRGGWGEVGEKRNDPENITLKKKWVWSVQQCLQCCAGLFGPQTGRVGVASDALPLLRTMCDSENIRERCHGKRRFRHYFQSSPIDLQQLKTLPLITSFSKLN